MSALFLLITSPPDRANVVAEVWFGADQVAEVFASDKGEKKIEIFKAPNNEVWSFDLEEFQDILLLAKKNIE